jgi:methyl-accepting chemotaxis protein
MRTMTVGRKVVLLAALALAFLAVVGGAGYVGASRLAGVIEQYDASEVPTFQALSRIATAVGRATGAASALENGALDDETHQKSLEMINSQVLAAAEAAHTLFEMKDVAGMAEMNAKATPIFGAWGEDLKALEALARDRAAAATRFAEAAAIQVKVTAQFEKLREDSQQLLEVIDQTVAVTHKDAGALHGRAATATAAARWVLGLAFLVAAGLLTLAGGLIARAVNRGLGALRQKSLQLTSAVSEGRLSARADATSVDGEFRPIVEGMNQTMDAFTRPMQFTAEYVGRLATGDIPPKITDRYEGDFNAIKQNLNRCIDAIGALVQDAQALSVAAIEGKLSTRADVSKHQGDYAKIVAGVNGTLDAVMGPINEAAQVLEKLAQRDLRARMAGSYRGDHTKIKDALNATGEALHQSLSQVAQAVNQVSSASAQIASSSQAVASGASEQASSLEETSSSLESLSSMTKQAAGNAQQANGLAQRARSAAIEGGTAIAQMTGAMVKIKASAEGTSQIIKDINEIAFQTNLLALNAAVEAARAGEAGRGFAVVAEEVRSLALRSKEAANKTEELIRQSVKEAGEGEVTAKRVTEVLTEISGSVTKVTDIVAEIAASAKEQSAGIDQINRAMSQMNSVTQQSAASSEESSSAAADLSGQAEELAAMVGSFRLEERDEAPALCSTTTPRNPKALPSNALRVNGKANGQGRI